MRTAVRTHTFSESVIRGMTRLANEHGAINLAQGFPNFPAPDVLKRAAAQAIHDDINQYAITWGSERLRRALVAKYATWYGMMVDPVAEITVTCGATEAMASVMLALVNPGDQVVVLEPFYENYGPDAILCEAEPVYVPFLPGEPLDLDRLAAAFGPKTRAIIVNTPNNPTGRVLSLEELTAIAELCIRHDAYAITDEIYEHIYYEGKHIPIATLPEMANRTITVSGASKTFSVTGWRVGTIVAPQDLTDAIRKVHDFLTVCAPAPFQRALVEALRLPESYYEEVRAAYGRRRELLSRGLERAGWRVNRPQGTYFLLVDVRELGIPDDREWAIRLARERGVAGVPGSAFLWRGMPQPRGEAPDRRGTFLRLSFGKREEQLERAVERLANGPR